jgi:hypothetical protein
LESAVVSKEAAAFFCFEQANGERVKAMAEGIGKSQKTKIRVSRKSVFHGARNIVLEAFYENGNPYEW